jgi:catechol 2,3-dioxygenase-like lactoylglutathione lyase family enzyme
MITAVHTLLYAEDAEAARAFFRDVIGWPNVDAHGGWLIFRTGPSELGVHPASGTNGAGDWSVPQHHEVTLVCDDVEATVGELGARGVEFDGDVKEEGFGRTVRMKVPGAGEIMIYEPKHPTAYDLEA